jgi:hypothetical protein
MTRPGASVLKKGQLDAPKISAFPRRVKGIACEALGRTMDEREIEQGYAGFHRILNHVLRQRDVKKFKMHVAKHPAQAGRLSLCLGLSDELAEVEGKS